MRQCPRRVTGSPSATVQKPDRAKVTKMKHASHPDIIARLKRAHGHLASVIQMIETGRPCVDLAQQLSAVESAITKAKREMINDHIEHCLGNGMAEGDVDSKTALREFKALTKYL